MKASLTDKEIAKAVVPAGKGYFVKSDDLADNFNRVYEHMLKLLRIPGAPHVTQSANGLVGFYATRPDEKKREAEGSP